MTILRGSRALISSLVFKELTFWTAAPGTTPWWGGGGYDTYAVDSLSDAIIENLREGTDTAIAYVNNYVLAANVENLYAGLTSGMTLTGNGSSNTVAGSSGNDILD